MRIALDSTPLIEPFGGIPRYVTELALALAEQEPGDEIHLLSDQTGLHFDPRLRERPNIILDPPNGPRFGGKWWSAALPWELRRRKIDIFHGTNFEVPYLPAVPSVLSLHDLSPWHEPPVRPEGSDRVRRRAPWLLKRARLTLTPSEAIRAEACRRFRLEPARVVAIHHGVSGGEPPSAADIETALNLLEVRRPFILYLGAAGARKNLETVVAAWRAGRGALQGYGLVLAGPGTERFRAAGGGLQALGTLPQSQAQSLLAAASMFVYPSCYEGFGLPVVEAMRAGAPVVVSRDPALLETAGDAALAADAGSVEQWTRAMLELAGNPMQASELRRRGLERAGKFDWRSCAKRTRAVYERAIGRN